ncbi:hypothetical protein [Streptomyces sp. FH025]|nr:hypothetical protein [Streptomyces sp. FH025]MBO1416637.1 hypothetical protein [Streptomyces sp. FH025]
MTNENALAIREAFGLGGDLTVRRIGFGTMRLADAPAARLSALAEDGAA